MSNYRRYYIPNSIVFVTIITNQRCPLLIENIEHLRLAFKNCKQDFTVLAGVVLPDHCHILLKPVNIKDYPKIISSIKYAFSKNIIYEKENKTKTEIKRKEKCAWQRRYYDHIIRNEDDLNKHLDYIHYNPIKHNLVKTAKDWEYSSFSKFVDIGVYEDNWCNLEDKNNCSSLNFE